MKTFSKTHRAQRRVNDSSKHAFDEPHEEPFVARGGNFNAGVVSGDLFLKLELGKTRKRKAISLARTSMEKRP